MTLVVRATTDTGATMAALRTVVHSLDPRLGPVPGPHDDAGLDGINCASTVPRNAARYIRVSGLRADSARRLPSGRVCYGLSYAGDRPSDLTRGETARYPAAHRRPGIALRLHGACVRRTHSPIRSLALILAPRAFYPHAARPHQPGNSTSLRMSQYRQARLPTASPQAAW